MGAYGMNWIDRLIMKKPKRLSGAGKKSGMPAYAISPITVVALVMLGVFVFGGLRYFGHRNAASLMIFKDLYSDRQIAQNLQCEGFEEPAKSSLSILAYRRSSLGEEKARELLKNKDDCLSGAMYLAALGYEESIPYLIQSLEPFSGKGFQKYYNRKIFESLKQITEEDLGVDPEAWKDWWHETHPEDH